MPNYRRNFVAGGTYFFTLKSEGNAAVFNDASAGLLGMVMREARERWSYETVASVLLPDHLKLIWALPPGDQAYPMRLGWIKKEYTKRFLSLGGAERTVSYSKRLNRRRGVWQRRYWEHTIQDEDDLRACADYIHFNPVKHGYAKSPRDWKWTSFHRWVELGEYEIDWGRTEIPPSVNLAFEAGE